MAPDNKPEYSPPSGDDIRALTHAVADLGKCIKEIVDMARPMLSNGYLGLAGRVRTARKEAGRGG